MNQLQNSKHEIAQKSVHEPEHTYEHEPEHTNEHEPETAYDHENRQVCIGKWMPSLKEERMLYNP